MYMRRDVEHDAFIQDIELTLHVKCTGQQFYLLFCFIFSPEINVRIILLHTFQVFLLL